MRTSPKVLILISSILFSLNCGIGDRGFQSPLVDFDGNHYYTVRIGTQVWMAENLRVTKTSDGEPVSSHLPNDDSSNVKMYGRLYDWHTALRIAPKGWHVPTDDEWKILEEHVGPLGAIRLKDTVHWRAAIGHATNETGFAARPAGYWNDSGFDNRFGQTAVFWSSTRVDSHFVWSRTISANHDTLRRAPQHPQYGFSVRCVKDKE